MDGEHLAATLRRAATHNGSAFVEIYQNCKIFNDGVFEYVTDKMTKADNALYLEHGRPLLFGKDRTKALVFNGFDPLAVELDDRAETDGLPVHDEQAPRPTLAQILAGLGGPEFPECFGVFRSVERPAFEPALTAGPRLHGSGIADVFASDDTWKV